MASGTLPFPNETSGAIFESILSPAPVPTVRLTPDQPTKLADTISKALEKDREQRYQSAADMRADLQRLNRSKCSLWLCADSSSAEYIEEHDTVPPPNPRLLNPSCDRR